MPHAALTHAEPAIGRRYAQMTRAVMRSGRGDLVVALAEGRMTVAAAYFTLHPPQDVGLRLLRRGWAKATPTERARFLVEVGAASAP